MIKLPPREYWFQYILGLTALFVASLSAFFSVMGIGMLFSGAMISSMLMATSLETGKIVATSFLYRYWNKASRFLKFYLAAAIAILVIITSLGVFGWLSSAYQSSALQYELNQQQIAVIVDQKKTTDSQAELSQKRIESLMKMRSDQEGRMNEALSNPILSRNPTGLRQVQEQNMTLIKQTDANITEEKATHSKFVEESMNKDKQILELKTTSNKTKDVITFKFVADALGLDLNSTVKWFIVIIIVVFDPLAVCLVLAYNVVAADNKKYESPVVPTVAPIEPTPPKTEDSTVAPSSVEVPVSQPKILLNELPVQVEELAGGHKAPEATDAFLRHSDSLNVPRAMEPIRK